MQFKDLLREPLASNTYLVNAELEDGWMPVGGLCLSMMPEDFQKEWSDILESPVTKLAEDGAYGREIHVAVNDGQRLQDFPFAILPLIGERQQQNTGLPASRKAEMFDDLVDSVHGLMSDGSWYDIFREIGMSDEEMRSAGLDLSGLKLTEDAVRKMTDHIVDEIKATKMEGSQLHVDFSVDGLADRFGINLNSSVLAEDMVFAELYSREEIDSADLIDGTLHVKPDNDLIDRLHELEPPELTMM